MTKVITSKEHVNHYNFRKANTNGADRPAELCSLVYAVLFEIADLNVRDT